MINPLQLQITALVARQVTDPAVVVLSVERHLNSGRSEQQHMVSEPMFAAIEPFHSATDEISGSMRLDRVHGAEIHHHGFEIS